MLAKHIHTKYDEAQISYSIKLEYQGQIRTSISDLKIITQTFKLCLAQKKQGKGQTKQPKDRKPS